MKFRGSLIVACLALASIATAKGEDDPFHLLRLRVVFTKLDIDRSLRAMTTASGDLPATADFDAWMNEFKAEFEARYQKFDQVVQTQVLPQLNEAVTRYNRVVNNGSYQEPERGRQIDRALAALRLQIRNQISPVYHLALYELLGSLGVGHLYMFTQTLREPESNKECFRFGFESPIHPGVRIFDLGSYQGKELEILAGKANLEPLIDLEAEVARLANQWDSTVIDQVFAPTLLNHCISKSCVRRTAELLSQMLISIDTLLNGGFDVVLNGANQKQFVRIPEISTRQLTSSIPYFIAPVWIHGFTMAGVRAPATWPESVTSEQYQSWRKNR